MAEASLTFQFKSFCSETVLTLKKWTFDVVMLSHNMTVIFGFKNWLDVVHYSKKLQSLAFAFNKSLTAYPPSSLL